MNSSMNAPTSNDRGAPEFQVLTKAWPWVTKCAGIMQTVVEISGEK